MLALKGTEERAEIVVGLLAGFGTGKLRGDALMGGGQADGPAADLGRIEVRDDWVLRVILCEHA